MPVKTSPRGHEYKVGDKKFEWTTEDGEVLTLPMRLKLKVIRSLSGEELDPSTMFVILESIAPGQGSVLDEMDVNEFVDCFSTWQAEYQALTGASLGESGSSSA